MSPLDVDIWLYVMAAYILVSVTMFIVARFSPYEWKNPHPCVADSDVMENQFSMANSFWFTIVTLMHQGCDLNPKVYISNLTIFSVSLSLSRSLFFLYHFYTTLDIMLYFNTKVLKKYPKNDLLYKVFFFLYR